MRRYRYQVIWTMDLMAASADEAAREARYVQVSSDPATFYVTRVRKDGHRTDIITINPEHV